MFSAIPLKAISQDVLMNLIHSIMGFLCYTLKLEQLERLCSEDTPRRLMITHTIESYWIPSQKKTKSKLQI